MAIALLLIGIVFMIAGVRGTEKELFALLKDDFTGPNNFILWGLALFVIGAVGYFKPLKPLSNSFMVLVLIVMLLSNKGFFTKFMAELKSTQKIVPDDLSFGAIPIGQIQNQILDMVRS